MAKIEVELADGSKAGESLKSLTKEAGKLRKELAGMTSGSKEFQETALKLNKAEASVKNLREEIKGTTSASDKLKNAWNKLPGAQFFNQIGESFGLMKSGVGGLVSSFGMLKTAIAATGIGLLVLALGTLYTWFKKVNTGADLLEDIFASIGATIDVLIDRLGRFGSGLVEFLSGNFSKGIDMMGDSFKGMGDEIARDVALAQELTAAMRDLEDAEIDYRVKSAETENQIKRLMLQARNRTLSEQERIAILEQAMALEKNLNAELLKNSEEALRIANMQAAKRLNIERGASESQIEFGKRILEEFKKDGQVQADDLRDKVVDMLVAMEDAGGKSLALQEKIINQRDALIDKSTEQSKKDNEQLLKEQEKFEAEQNKRNEKQETYQESRKVAELEKEKKHIQASMVLAAKHLQSKIADNEAEAASRKQLNDAIIAMESEKLAVFNEGVSSVVSLLAVDEAARKKNATAIKFFETGRVAVNGIAEISAIAKTFAELGPVGQILAIAKIAFSGIRTAAAIKRINSQKFEYGGAVLNGPRHAQGGIPIEAEGGEIIMTRGVYSNPALRSAASAINVAGGGRSFAAGGVVNPLDSSRGPVPSGRASSGGQSPLIDYTMMREVFRESVRDEIYKIQVTNNLQDTNKGLNVLNQLKAEADV